MTTSAPRAATTGDVGTPVSVGTFAQHTNLARRVHARTLGAARTRRLSPGGRHGLARPAAPADRSHADRAHHRVTLLRDRRPRHGFRVVAERCVRHAHRRDARGMRGGRVGGPGGGPRRRAARRAQGRDRIARGRGQGRDVDGPRRGRHARDCERRHGGRAALSRRARAVAARVRRERRGDGGLSRREVGL